MSDYHREQARIRSANVMLGRGRLTWMIELVADGSTQGWGGYPLSASRAVKVLESFLELFDVENLRSVLDLRVTVLRKEAPVGASATIVGFEVPGTVGVRRLLIDTNPMLAVRREGDWG